MSSKAVIAGSRLNRWVEQYSTARHQVFLMMTAKIHLHPLYIGNQYICDLRGIKKYDLEPKGPKEVDWTFRNKK
jgi:hypothetical protein